MLDKLISAVITFVLMLIPSVPSQTSISTTNQTSILFTGDIMLGRSVMGAALDANDSFYPFRKVESILKNNDITFVNLENPIVTNCPRHAGGFKFCTTPEIAKGLNISGVDIVSLANNHSGNYGKEGFEETKKYLTQDGVKYVGDENLEIIEKNGIKFGFLGFNYTFTKDNLESDLSLIKESDMKVDILIVGNHWGDEYQSVGNSFQKSSAKKMVENGADVIIGHHPHWVQDYEEIDGKPVYYSLGNFIFDQMWSEETKKGLVVKMTFEDKKLVKREGFKTYTTLIGQPEIIMESPKE
jgi:poly-gamma-glutamate capsule biosynthesis protein CapA/YwtB (metallophosphatase superfamily)